MDEVTTLTPARLTLVHRLHCAVSLSAALRVISFENLPPLSATAVIAFAFHTQYNGMRTLKRFD